MVTTRNRWKSQAARPRYPSGVQHLVVLGEIVGGIMMDTYAWNSPRTALRVSNSYGIPGSVERYIDLAGGTGTFISHPALVLANDGTGDFSGEVSAESFTAPTAVFSGTVQAGVGALSAQLTSDVLNFRDGGGVDRAQFGRLGNHAVIQASANIQLNAGGSLVLNGKVVSYGDPDSGGPGVRALVVPN